MDFQDVGHPGLPCSEPALRVVMYKNECRSVVLQPAKPRFFEDGFVRPSRNGNVATTGALPLSLLESDLGTVKPS